MLTPPHFLVEGGTPADTRDALHAVRLRADAHDVCDPVPETPADAHDVRHSHVLICESPS